MKKILGLAGSLRRGSYNRLLLEAAMASQHPGLAIEIFDDLSAVPLFNQDLERPLQEAPDGVRRLVDATTRADGLLIATPEYNHSIPGVLKNAIDWLSRSSVGEPLIGKPIALMGASSGQWGTRLSQAALRQTLTSTEALVMPAPMLFVREAARIYDDSGRLVDERTRTSLAALLDALARWIDMTNATGK